MGTQATSINIKIKSPNGYVLVSPKTSIEQIEGKLPIETYGPFTYTLLQSSWIANTPRSSFYQQIIKDNNTALIKSEDKPYCVKILEGTSDQMILQQKAYDMLDPIIGIRGNNGSLEFVATEKPPIDIKLQVYWTH